MNRFLRLTLHVILLVCITLPLYPAITGCQSNSSSTDPSNNESASVDTDNDGLTNDVDPDDDNDGILDEDDAFPTDSSESADLDGDGIGNNADDDADGDGFNKDDDCNDLASNIHPEATDSPDSEYIDSNCDGVDGTISQAIWVSQNEGNNSNLGTFLEPVKTIERGIDLASTQPEGQRDIYIVQGNYPEDVLVENNTNLYGGFSPLVDGVRSRHIGNYTTKITGLHGANNVSIEFHDGPIALDYSLLVQNSNSIIEGLTIEGDEAGLNVVIIDSPATIRHCHLLDNIPSVARNVTITLVNLVTQTQSSNLTVSISNNTFSLFGNFSRHSDEMNIGILGWPAKDADTAVIMDVENNHIESQGLTDKLVGILVADDDDNPNDSASGDMKADFSLKALQNTIELKSETTVAVGIMAGASVGGKIAPPSDKLFYLDNLELTHNFIRINPSTANAAFGITASLVRKEALISNNIIEIKGTVDEVYGLYSLMTPLQAYFNTFSMTTIDKEGLFGLVTVAMDGEPDLINYVDNRPLAMTNNIISLNLQSTTTLCKVHGVYEHIDSINDSFVNAASPLQFAHNDIHIDSNCSEKFIYTDRDSTSSRNQVATLDDLENKVGFRSDDPGEFFSNIDLNPQFVNPAISNYQLQETSPCIDSGYLLDGTWNDFSLTQRYLGSGMDIGAFESF